MRKKILLLSTGGTIASVVSADGLVPKKSGQELLKRLGPLPYEIEIKDIFQLDSSNIQPEEWRQIAEAIYQERKNYDGIVVSHGTDTMAYTASILTFMLQGIEIPVILTGSQVPINVILSDAIDNLRLAFAAAASAPAGIYLAFHDKIMLGCRSVKVRTTNYDAFESVNLPPVARVNSDGLIFNHELHWPTVSKGCQLNTKIDPHVALIKLFPGFDPHLLTALVDNGCHGIVIEGYGLGGMNYIRRNIVAEIGQLIKRKVPVIAASQCLYERSDLTKYEVGRLALLEGAISAHDMTSESAITKLMWALGQGMDVDQVAALFKQNLAGEVSL
jgi:L-asparaginase